MIIETPNLRLRLCSREELLEKFTEMPEVSPDWLARIRDATAPDPWSFGYAVERRADGTFLGNAAFKGPPDEEGMVEIAYGIEPEHQRCGHATEAALGLVDFAFRDPRVRVVRAHTLLDHVASMRVLEKCGFMQIGQVIEPEDGLVWRYERQR